MYQDETEKELEENGFRVVDGGADDEDADTDMPPGMPDDLPLFGDDDESDDPESRFH